MSFNGCLPTYVGPCIVEKTSENDWESVLEFGEYYFPPSDSQEYPSLTLMYNGKVLKVPSELVHASLSGISIKHYYGKCCDELTYDEFYENNKFPSFHCPETEVGSYFWFNEPETLSTAVKEEKSINSTPSDSFEYQDETEVVEGQPLCTLPKINSRNSFWNIHKPELCKLTWGQKYVSAATVTKHLHEHLTSHGPICNGFHTEEDRSDMLTRELDEYVRLKVLACPKELPPDEPPFDMKAQPKYSPKCKAQMKFFLTDNIRTFQIKNDEEIRGKEVRRSKAEFCLTIGKHIPELQFVPSEKFTEEPYITPELSTVAGEEAYDGFYYDWFFYGEEPMEMQSNITSSIRESSEESSEEICPQLMLDDFCRAVGKADFSDLRPNPDL